MSKQRKELLMLYKQLLRSCETYPSKNRVKIYESIRQEFRDSKSMDPNSTKAQTQIHVAWKGLDQLRQFNGRQATNFSIHLEQNPFPKPDHYTPKK